MTRVELVLDGEMQAFIRGFHLRKEMPLMRRDCMEYTALIRGDSFNVFHRLPAGFTEVGYWADDYLRRVWVDYDREAICTYCEHDLRFQIFETEVAFDAAIERAWAYYEKDGLALTG